MIDECARSAKTLTEFLQYVRFIFACAIYILMKKRKKKRKLLEGRHIQVVIITMCGQFNFIIPERNYVEYKEKISKSV